MPITHIKKVKDLYGSVLAVIMGILLIFAGFTGYQLLNQTTTTDQYVSASERQTNKEKIVLAVNNERIKAGLAALAINPLLAEAAQKKAENMVLENYFSHTRVRDSYKWSDYLDAEGYNYRFAGENLAKGYTNIDSMVIAWMNSPTHKENILGAEYAETGIGIAYRKADTGDVMYVAQMFGKLY